MCTACATVEKVPTDPRLMEAQYALEEGKRLSDAGQYAAAVPLVERALELRQTVLSDRHPRVADCVGMLGRLHFTRADYARAEPLLARALEIRKAALGQKHPEVAASLNDLANLYVQQGLYEQAELSYTRALEIQGTALGENHPHVAILLNNMAHLYQRQGLYDRAEPLLLRALRIWEAALIQTNPVYLPSPFWKSHERGDSSRNYERGDSSRSYERADSSYARAMRLQEVGFSKKHPAVAALLNNLANLYRHQGHSARAELLSIRALKVSEATLGETHPDVIQALNNLARVRIAQQNLGAALPLLERALTASEQHLRQENFGFSERSLASFLDRLRAEENHLYALARAHPGNARVLHLALSAALLRKGRSVEEVANTSRLISRNLDSAGRETFERLRALRTQLATLSLAGPGGRSPEDYQQRLKELAAEGDALEANLSRRSAPLRSLAALPSAAHIVDRVAEALPKDSALVELISYEDKQLRYLALVLFPDSRIRAVDLGLAAPIDKAASSLRDALARRDTEFHGFAQAFYQRAFMPLLPLLGGTRRLVLSPDGQFNIVPFAALHDGRQFLVEAFDFSYVTSGKDLLPRPGDIVPSNSLVVLADPDFGTQAPAAALALAGTPRPTERSGPIGRLFSALRTERAEDSWSPLPGSRQEAETLQRLVPGAQLLLGRDASKEQLLRLPTPGILHIATHGFFLEDAPTPLASRAIGNFGALGQGASRQMPANPLLRSGLALAGALVPASTSTASLSRDSALITALELAGLDLWGTELVVLSACDTGRGDIKLGQGVYGLRRALVVAGAETVVMSLWKVNDDTTSLLMEAYYRNLLAGQGRATALREAMRSLRVSLPHPHYWAPFIALGRDAPLQALDPASLGK
jgi:CHAT domain-containing protein